MLEWQDSNFILQEALLNSMNSYTFLIHNLTIHTKKQTRTRMQMIIMK